LEKLEQLRLIEAGIRIDTPSMRPPQLATRSISNEPGSTSFQPL
jgi:CMP-2-keto-3-deoxyoctulosonic acid synthetase